VAACKLTWFAPPTAQICEQKTLYSSYVLRPFCHVFVKKNFSKKVNKFAHNCLL